MPCRNSRYSPAPCPPNTASHLEVSSTSPPRQGPTISTVLRMSSSATTFSTPATLSLPRSFLSATTSTALRSVDPSSSPSSITDETRPSSSATGSSTTTSTTVRASRRYLSPPGAMAISPTYLLPPALSSPSTIPTLLF